MNKILFRLQAFFKVLRRLGVWGSLLLFSAAAHSGDDQLLNRLDFFRDTVSLEPVKLLTEGKHARIWVYADLERPSSASVSRLKALIDEFDQKIYPGVTEVIPDLHPQEKVDLVFEEIRDKSFYQGFSFDKKRKGFFHPQQLGPRRLLLDIHTLSQSDSFLNALITHEFTHVLQYAHDPEEVSFLNEGIAVLMEKLIYGVQHESSFVLFMKSPNHDLTDFADASASDYAHAYLFFMHLYRNFGGRDLISEIVQSPIRGIKSLDEILRSKNFKIAGDEVDFELAFKYFSLALFLNSRREGVYRLYDLTDATLARAHAQESFPQQVNLLPYSAQYFQIKGNPLLSELPPGVVGMWIYTRSDRVTLIRDFGKPLSAKELESLGLIHLALINPQNRAVEILTR